MSAHSTSQAEKAHMAALRRFEKHDHSLEQGLDHITALVAWFFNVPISVIALILEEDSIVLSFYGLEKRPTQHRPEWCKAAVASDDIFCISNALEDPRVKSDPFVIGEFGLRFFAAVPLRARDGRGLGTLSVVDRKPRTVTVSEKEFLRRMALVAVDLIDSHLKTQCPPVPLSTPSPFSISFNRSIIGKPEYQQIEWLGGLVIGESPAIQKVRELLRLAIEKQADSVLLLGETGTGKGVCARAIHEGSGARGHFIEVNCAALPHDLIESELFGHEKGSFTGATGRKIGLFEQASGGTIFLDEIAELPPDLQVKLLSVLQGRELRRVGGDRAIPIDVRVVAATNRPLDVALSDGSFRRDLFFRIGSWRIELPLLRHRGDDVILLARHFTAQLAREKGHPIGGIAPEAGLLLKQYDWPGNVRQLLNVIEHAIILESSSVISREAVRRTLEEENNLFNSHDHTVDSSLPSPSLFERKRVSITESEALSITEALARNRNVKSKTAKELGLTRTQLEYRLKLIGQMNHG
jgi:transcriptional regulator with GAF, ATPase, and Fis domain